MSFRNVCHSPVGELPIGLRFPINNIKEFIKSCENLEFLVLGFVPRDIIAAAILSCAVEHCEHLSELYLSKDIEVDYYSIQWNEILISEEFRYDSVGDIILDFDKLHPIKVERLRQYTEAEWNELHRN